MIHSHHYDSPNGSRLAPVTWISSVQNPPGNQHLKAELFLSPIHQEKDYYFIKPLTPNVSILRKIPVGA